MYRQHRVKVSGPICGAKEPVNGLFDKITHGSDYHECIIGKDINHATHFCKECNFTWKNPDWKPEPSIWGRVPYGRFPPGYGPPTTPGETPFVDYPPPY